ncbi:MAG: ribonuclease HIII [Acholeplasmatales bacterium]|jgi:ribonuclease HIII|nr:ribonuclease HIII [Acholeplasmatales bacterium]
MGKIILNGNQILANILRKEYITYEYGSLTEGVFFSAFRDNSKLIITEDFKIIIEGYISKFTFEIYKILERNDFSAYGSDEVGTGDVFGPVVVVSVYIERENIIKLKKFNIRDSKTYTTNNSLLTAYNSLINLVQFESYILMPREYNKLYEKVLNLNAIKALMHNEVNVKLMKKIGLHMPVIIDQFTSEDSYYSYLSEETTVLKDIYFSPRAESIHLSVACASIIARKLFLDSIKTLSNEIGITLPLGASYIVDDVLRKIYSSNKNILPLCSKMHFSNVKRIN